MKLEELILKFLWQFKGPRTAKAVLAKRQENLLYWILRLIIEHYGNPLQYSCLENPIDGRAWLGCSPQGSKELGTTERLHFHLSCIGEGNGNPLQYSCLENPRDRGASWAAIYGVTQSRTQLKRVSSSSILTEVR